MTCEQFLTRLQAVLTRAYPGEQRSEDLTDEDIEDVRDALLKVCDEAHDVLVLAFEKKPFV